MTRDLWVVGAAIVAEGRVLAARRGDGMTLAGQWELPGGKIEDGEGPRAALQREIREELGVEIDVGPYLASGAAPVENDAGRRLRLDVYLCNLQSGRPRPQEHAEIRWVGPAEIDDLDWADADRPVLGRLRGVLLSAAERRGGSSSEEPDDR